MQLDTAPRPDVGMSRLALLVKRQDNQRKLPCQVHIEQWLDDGKEGGKKWARILVENIYGQAQAAYTLKSIDRNDAGDSPATDEATPSIATA